MSDERRDRFDDLKEAYALGALTEDERREFEDYLATHPELRAEVEEIRTIADLLALAPQEHEPPSELRRNLLNRIGGGATDATLAGAPTRRERLRGLFGPGGLVAAAAALVLVALLVWNFSSRNENPRGNLQTPQAYELHGSGEARNVRGEVVRVGDDRAVLVAENLPPAPEGKVYEAWLMRNGVPEPAGLFESSDEGPAATSIEGSFKDADAVAVTAEPSGGSSTPTGEILLTATL